MIECKFSFGCNPSKTVNHSFKPSKIPGESAFVLLGLDFLAQFDSTIFDWKNNRMKVGNDWVYFANEGNEGEPKQKLDISKQLLPKQHREVSKLIGNFFDSVFAHDPKAPKEANMGFHVIETKSGNPHKAIENKTVIRE